MAKHTAVNVNKCPICRTREGEFSPQFGLIGCKECREGEQAISSRTVEIIPERIKEGYKSHRNQTIQPFRNGQLSKEYLDLYGTKHIEVTEDEVKSAKNVWNDLEYYKND